MDPGNVDKHANAEGGKSQGSHSWTWARNCWQLMTAEREREVAFLKAEFPPNWLSSTGWSSLKPYTQKPQNRLNRFVFMYFSYTYMHMFVYTVICTHTYIYIIHTHIYRNNQKKLSI